MPKKNHIVLFIDLIESYRWTRCVLCIANLPSIGDHQQTAGQDNLDLGSNPR